MTLIDVTCNGNSRTKYISSCPDMVVANCAACGCCIAREMTRQQYSEWGRRSRMCGDCEVAVRKLKDGNGRFLLSINDDPVNGLRYLREIRAVPGHAPIPIRGAPQNHVRLRAGATGVLLSLVYGAAVFLIIWALT